MSDIHLLAYYPPSAPGYKVEGWSDDRARLDAQAESRNETIRTKAGAGYRKDLDGYYAVFTVWNRL